MCYKALLELIVSINRSLGWQHALKVQGATEEPVTEVEQVIHLLLTGEGESREPRQFCVHKHLYKL